MRDKYYKILYYKSTLIHWEQIKQKTPIPILPGFISYNYVLSSQQNFQAIKRQLIKFEKLILDSNMSVKGYYPNSVLHY